MSQEENEQKKQNDPERRRVERTVDGMPQDEGARLAEAEQPGATEIFQPSALPRLAVPGSELPDAPAQEPERRKRKGKKDDQSYWRLVRRQFRKNRPAVFGLFVIVMIALVALFADVLANNKPLVCKYKGEWYFPVFQEYLVDLGLSQWEHPEFTNNEWKTALKGKYETVIFPPVPFRAEDTDDRGSLAAPFSGTNGHLLGTDQLGRDLFAGMIHGSRISLLVGIVAMGIATLIGVVLGAIAGYFGGWVDMAVSRLIELFLNFPVFFLIITLVAFNQDSPDSLIFMIMAVIGLTGWMGIARLTRGEVLRVRMMEYVSAAAAVGFSPMRIIFRHVLPNSLAPVLVSIAFGIASAILTEAALSFLGFGVPATTVTWGSMLSESRGAVYAWWLAVFPGLMIFLTVLSYNLVGDGLRDATDPRLKI